MFGANPNTGQKRKFYCFVKNLLLASRQQRRLFNPNSHLTSVLLNPFFTTPRLRQSPFTSIFILKHSYDLPAHHTHLCPPTMRTASALPTVLLIAIVQVASSNAAFEPHRSFSRATDKFHKFALKHSAGLARDLRIAFSGLAGRAVSEPDDSQKVLCARPGTFVSPSNSTSPASAPDNGGHVHPSTTGHHGGVSSTSSAKGPGSTSLPSPSSLAPQPAPTSAFKLQESHVRRCVSIRHSRSLQYHIISPETTFLTDGTFGICRTQLMALLTI